MFSALVRFPLFLGIVLFLAVPTSGLAQDHVHEVSQETRNKAVEFVGKMLHALESDDPDATYFAKFTNKINPKNLFFRIKRAYQLYSEKDPDQAGNVLFLFVISHTLETISGPIYVIQGIINGENIWVIIGPGSGLMTQMLPGLDMGCFVIFGTYVASPELQKVITNARMYTVAGVLAASEFTGLDKILGRLIQVEPAAQWVANTLASAEHRAHWGWLPGDTPQATLSTKSGKPLAKFGFHVQRENHLSLDSIRFSVDALRRENLEHLGVQTRGLGWDVSEAAYSTFQRLVELRDKEQFTKLLHNPFVDRVIVHEPGMMCEEIFWSDNHVEKCACPHGHHDENVHKHEKDVATERGETFLTSRFSDTRKAPIPEGTIEVRFKRPAIQVGGKWHYDVPGAVSLIPGCVGGTCLKTLDASMMAPFVAWNALLNSPYFLWEHRWTIPNATLTTLKIGKELVVNTTKAGLYLGGVGVSGINWCWQQLAAAQRNALPMP
jgi:hypothetical protein